VQEVNEWIAYYNTMEDEREEAMEKDKRRK
jgi:hypothetical protein